MGYKNSVALIFEASHGCQMSCDGCRVNKHAANMPSPATMAKLKNMFTEFEQAGLPFTEIEIGPTDLMSALNRDEIFDSEDVAWLARKFMTTTLAASFIHPSEQDYIRFAKQVHTLTPDNVVGIAIPLEMSHVFNDKYIGRIKNNVEVFRSHLPNRINEVILNVIFDERYLTNVGSKHNYEDLFARIHDLRVSHNTKVDFVFHHGRQDITKPLVAENFLHSFRELNRHYLKDLRRRAGNMEPRHIPFQLLCDARGGEIVYHNDELYLRPVLNERVTVFHDRMKFQGEWTADNYFTQYFNILNRNIELAQTYNDCPTCDHQAICAERCVQDLMKLCGTKNCITLLKNHGGIAAIIDESDFKKLALD